MNLDQQVVSLSLAKRLAELGVKQRSLFYWMANEAICYRSECLPFLQFMGDQWWSAFTASELLEMLPKELESNDKLNSYEICIKWELHYSCNNMWHITYVSYTQGSRDFIIYDEFLCNALAKTLIHLLENKLIETQK